VTRTGLDDSVQHDVGWNARLLEGLTIGYVTLPFVIFVCGWLKLWIALPVLALLLLGAWDAGRARGWAKPSKDPFQALSRRDWTILLGLFLLVVLLVAYSGAGGYAFQYQDYNRHNAFMRDLIDRPWPLAFATTPPKGQPGMLAFYIANSLPPAAIGKLLGWSAANFASWLWTLCGVYLALCWFLRVLGRISVPPGLLFLFFGGLDVVGRVALLEWPDDFTRLFGNWMVEYALSSTPEARSLMQGVFWYFPSNLSFVYYAPHHVLGPWLCTLVIVHDAVREKSCRRSNFLFCLVLLWSAFSFVGLLPFVGLAALLTRARGMFSIANTVSAAAVLGITLLYVLSNNQSFPHGFLWQRQDLLRTWPLLLLFYAVEFGVYAAVCPRGPESPAGLRRRAWWWVSIACMLAAPWYVLGLFNDLTTKVGIPALVVFQLCLAASLVGPKAGSELVRKWALIALLMVGSIASLSDVARGLHHGLKPAGRSRNWIPHTNELGGPAAQLFSDGDAFFWRHLARTPKYD
jgi:hypothetical protein